MTNVCVCVRVYVYAFFSSLCSVSCFTLREKSWEHSGFLHMDEIHLRMRFIQITRCVFCANRFFFVLANKYLERMEETEITKFFLLVSLLKRPIPFIYSRIRLRVLIYFRWWWISTSDISFLSAASVRGSLNIISYFRVLTKLQQKPAMITEQYIIKKNTSEKQVDFCWCFLFFFCTKHLEVVLFDKKQQMTKKNSKTRVSSRESNLWVCFGFVYPHSIILDQLSFFIYQIHFHRAHSTFDKNINKSFAYYKRQKWRL